VERPQDSVARALRKSKTDTPVRTVFINACYAQYYVIT
jgi:hypothetical protein